MAGLAVGPYTASKHAVMGITKVVGKTSLRGYVLS